MGGYKEIELWDKEAAEQRAIQEERWREAAAAASVLGDEAVQALACARKKIERFASAWAECFESGALGTGCRWTAPGAASTR